MFKKMLCVLILAMGITVATAATVQADDEVSRDEISVTVDGRCVYFEGQQPAVIDGRTLVPIRGVFEELGFRVEWVSETRTVMLHRNEDERLYVWREAYYALHGTGVAVIAHVMLDVPAQVINGSTMMPARALIEAVGYSVSWDATTRTVVISTQPNTPQVYLNGMLADIDVVLVTDREPLLSVEDAFALLGGDVIIRDGTMFPIVHTILGGNFDWCGHATCSPVIRRDYMARFQHITDHIMFSLVVDVQAQSSPWEIMHIGETRARFHHGRLVAPLPMLEKMLGLEIFQNEAGIHIIKPPYFFDRWQALWLEEPRFTATAPAHMNTNNALEQSIHRLWYDHIQPLETLYVPFMPWFSYNIDDNINALARQAILDGFLQDSVQLPFTHEYIEKIINNIYFYFARESYFGPGYAGVYRPMPFDHYSYIFVEIPEDECDDSNRDWFTLVLLHELAHSFGLAENFADMFAEKMMGLDYAPFACCLILYYDTVMYRDLLRLMQLDGRESEFWQAAFSSNTAFAALWDEYFGQYVTAEELALVRSVSNWLGHIDEVMDIDYFILYDWNIMMGAPGARRDRVINYFQEGIDFFLILADYYALSPQPHVLERILATHLRRYYS